MGRLGRGAVLASLVCLSLRANCCGRSCISLTELSTHATRLASSTAGFVGEVKAKYSAQMAEVFRETFCWLPLGFVINHKVLVVSLLCLQRASTESP